MYDFDTYLNDQSILETALEAYENEYDPSEFWDETDNPE